MVLSGMIEEHPDIAELYIARSNLERERGRNELAMLDLKKAIEIDPNNANHHILKAIIYEKMGKNDAAKRCREKAAALRSYNENPGL